MTIRIGRSIFQNEHITDHVTFSTSIGEILFDKITVKEVSKGAKTDKSLFLKLEIASNFDKFIDRLTFSHSEEIDLEHNNRNNIFYKRKVQFLEMDVYSLIVNKFVFRVKIGKFRKGGYNLYSITEP